MKPTIRLIGTGFDFEVLLGDTSPQVTDGFATWDEVKRVDRQPLTQFTANALLKMSVPVLLDGHGTDTDQQPLLDRILALMRGANDNPPPTFTALGPIPLSGRVWVMDGPDWGDSLRNTAGVLVRQGLTLKLIEWSDPDTIKFKSDGPSNGGPTDRGAGGQRIYVTKDGDTLLSISKKLFKDTAHASVIGQLNGLRDIRKKLLPGIHLYLPAK
jgi:hypothetical protein